MMVMMLSSAALRDGELSGSTPAFNRPPSTKHGLTKCLALLWGFSCLSLGFSE